MSAGWKSDPKIIGENIKATRKKSGLTQEQLAEEIGGSCTNKVISRYERGTVEMGVQTLCDVAESLKVPVNELMPERLRVNTGEDEGLDELVAIFAGLTAERRLQLLQMARFLMAQETGKIM